MGHYFIKLYFLEEVKSPIRDSKTSQSFLLGSSNLSIKTNVENKNILINGSLDSGKKKIVQELDVLVSFFKTVYLKIMIIK